MRRFPLRVKITLWFTSALLIVVLFTYISVLSVSNQILQKTIRDNLIETVENNYNEIRFYSDISDMDLSEKSGHFLKFESGYLEVNDDFLDEVNRVYTSITSSDYVLLYGENPISLSTKDIKFIDSRIQTLKIDGTNYYVFDRKLNSKGLDSLWIRGIVSEEQGSVQMTAITRLSLILMPIIVIISCLGGYNIVKETLKPIHEISETARHIGEENDLKKRIELGPGNDELHRLADTFNDMFAKLDANFETQRRFISDASHELRTPMSVISAQCELSLENPGSPQECENAFRVISRQSGKMTKMINDMLDFTRLEGDPERYKFEKIDLTELVNSVCEDLALIGEKGIKLEYSAEEGVVIDGNRELLSRLITNLVVNAYRYGKEGGRIWVELKTQDKKVLLSVRDNGIGIKKEEQEKIFERFYQSDASRSGAGAGLGLSMASEIARFHGGKIMVESEPEKGSTFTLVMNL